MHHANVNVSNQPLRAAALSAKDLAPANCSYKISTRPFRHASNSDWRLVPKLRDLRANNNVGALNADIDSVEDSSDEVIVRSERRKRLRGGSVD